MPAAPRQYVWLIQPNGELRLYKEAPQLPPNIYPERWLMQPTNAERLAPGLFVLADAVTAYDGDLNIITPEGRRLSGRVLVVAVEPHTGHILKLTGQEVARLGLVTEVARPWPRRLVVLPCPTGPG